LGEKEKAIPTTRDDLIQKNDYVKLPSNIIIA